MIHYELVRGAKKILRKILPLFILGGLAVAIPGEVKGLYEIYKKHGGKIPWADLVEPAIKLAEVNVVTKPVAIAIKSVLKKKDKVSKSLL